MPFVLPIFGLLVSSAAIRPRMKTCYKTLNSGKGVNRPMSKPGLNNSTNTQNMKDFQGGEKKVMKKSLSVILSSAMALSMFSSVAFGKTSTDFTDLKDLPADQKAIYDAMISAGIFDGLTDTTFGLNDDMNRAQFAKIAAKILGLDTTATTSSFTDVKASDPANGYAVGAIEALKSARVTDGVTDTTFDPAGKVTKEQLAAFLIRVIGKDAEAKLTPAVNDDTVSTWAKGYVAFALNAKLVTNGTNGKYGGTSNAPRSLLVTGSFAAKTEVDKTKVPAQVSVTAVKATGVKTVQVTLDRDVDTAKATLSLTTAGTVVVPTTVKWSDDKKTATLTLTNTVLRAGDYKVTLGGLDASAVKLTTGTFTAQDESVQKIDFVTASDTLAKATNVVVKIKATNQYGELASASAGNYNFYGATKLTKNVDGYLLATVDTSAATSGVGIVTLTIINNDSHVTATKNFTVGTAPILTKLELGAPKYTNGTAITGTGDNAKFSLNLYDQYGSMMGYDALNIGGTNELKPTVIWNNYLENVTAVTEDDGNNNPILKISLGTNVDKSGDYNFTVIDQAASATGKVTIQSAKVATKVQIGALDDVIAAGDKNVYIPVIAYDAAGNQLSVDDLVSDDNYNRITVSSGNSSSNRIEKSGSHKGSIKLNTVPLSKNGAVSVSVFIATANVSSTDTKTYTVQSARIPDHFQEITAPGKQVTAGGFSDLQYAVIDQYGKQLDDLIAVDSQGNATSLTSSNYAVTVQASTYNAAGKLLTVAPGTLLGSAVNTIETTPVTSNVYAAVTVDNDPATTEPAVFGYAPVNLGLDLFAGLNDKTYRFNSLAGSAGYKVDLTLRILKDGNEITKLTKSATVAQATDDLTYSLNSVAALFNAKDNDAVADGLYDASGAKLLKVDQLDPIKSRFAREVIVSGKNKAGEVVGVAKQIKSITSSDLNVANVGLNTANGKAYVLGYKAGTATISVTFATAKGETKTINTTITVKADPLNAAKVTYDYTAYNEGLSFNAFLNLNVTDSYGRVYEDNSTTTSPTNGRAQKYNYLLGVTFSVSNVNNGTVSVDQYGAVTVTPSGTAAVTFDLIATTPTGKSATVSISSTSGGTRTKWK
jgi:hypothetical protein